MPQEEKPTLVQLATAHALGFRPIRLLHRDPHYVRVVREKSGRVFIECLPHDRLGEVSVRVRGSVLIRWYEDPLFVARLHTRLPELCGSLDEPHLLRSDRKGQFDIVKAR